MGDGFGEAGTKGDAEESSQPPHYLGHRERLRARFMEAGADALPDYELLELLLARAIQGAIPSRWLRSSWPGSAALPMCLRPRPSGSRR
jgi:hypothetical protein